MISLPGRLHNLFSDKVLPLYRIDLQGLCSDMPLADLQTKDLVTSQSWEQEHLRIQFIFEPRVRGDCLTCGVKASERQFEDIFEMTRYVASCLCIDAPQTYIIETAQPAFSIGTASQGLLGLAPSLVALLSPREILSVIGHEIWHIWHTGMGGYRYDEVMRRLSHALEAHLQRQEPAPPQLMAALSFLYQEQQKAEILADRVGLLCCQDLPSAQSALLKVMFRNAELASKVNIEDYIAEHLKMIEFLPGDVQIALCLSSHPSTARRLAAMGEFYQSRYASVLEKSKVTFDVAF